MIRTVSWFIVLASICVLNAGCGRPCKDIGLYTINPDGSGKQRVKLQMKLEKLENLFDPSWLADGKRIAFTDSCSWWTMNADGSRMIEHEATGWIGLSTRLAWIPTADNQQVRGFALLRGNQTERKVALHGFRGGWICGINPVPDVADNPTLSPDGRFVAYPDEVKLAADRFSFRIYTVSTATGRVRRLTQSALSDDAPTWSPDGRMIAFVRHAPATGGTFSAVYVMNADGSGQHVVAKSSDEVAWSPDGRKLVVNGKPTGGGEHLYIIDTRGNILRRLNAASQGLGLTWAPANKIAYVYDRGDNLQDKCGD